MSFHISHRLVSLAVAVSVMMTVSSFVYADEADIDEDIVCEEVYEETVVIDSEYDNDYLAEQYIMQQMSVGSEPLLRSYDYTAQLSDYNLMLFTALQPHIVAVANGTESSTEFRVDIGSFTAADLGLDSITTNGQSEFSDEVKDAMKAHLGINSGTVVHALMNACPYEMYWYDKTRGRGCSVSYILSGDTSILNVSYVFRFSVADEYAGSSAYTVDASQYGQALSNAASNARAIIDRYAADSDYDKLVAYRDEICALTEYNYYAADDDNNVSYGNPWQMIYVFDGNPNTTVVCEGYSKAFQFLCDNSTFQSNDIYAISVSGTLYSSNSGGHMWNIVHMEDGNNYLVDITNLDDDGPNLFLRGCTEAGGLYQVPGTTLAYSYDANTVSYYGASDLTISADDYVPSSVTPSGVEISETNFPDDNFRSIVSGLDTDSDGYMSDDEVASVTSMNLSYKNIESLEGIKYFTALTSLDCKGNSLVSLDVSGMTSLQYLFCQDNGLTSLDLTGCASLSRLSCYGNQLASLNMVDCASLVSIYTHVVPEEVNNCLIYVDEIGLLQLDSDLNVIASVIVPGWTDIDGRRYYVLDDGTYATGVQTIEGSVYCFADDGVMFTDGWVTVNGARYYCQSNGKAYVNTTQVIDGVTYVFDNQGKCVSETPVVSTVNMYRLYNPNSGEHFYTSNAGERDLLASLGWHDEGIGWIAPATSSTPVYRLYNANGGEHHYTTSVAERDFLVSIGWNDEGIGWYSDDAHSVPLYRQYNPNAFANNHNYTTSLSENNWLVSIGWQAEGIGWYGVG